MKVPVIDFQQFDIAQTASSSNLTVEVDKALSQIGFMSITNLGIDTQMLERVFAASRAFFSSNPSSKAACAYQSASENFGYQALCQEHLDPTKPADIKETFTMRNVLNHSPDDGRWPSVEFKDLMHDFFKSCIDGAGKIQRVLASSWSVIPILLNKMFYNFRRKITKHLLVNWNYKARITNGK